MVNVIFQCENDDFFFNHVVRTNPMNTFFEFHTHDTCEIIFLKSGNVSGIIGEKTYALRKNDLIIFRSNVPHRIRFDDNTEYERYNILFDENKMANRIFFKLPKSLDVISCDGNRRIIDLFDKIDVYCEKLDEEDAVAAVSNVIEELLFNLYLSPLDDLKGERITTHPIISSAIEYINAHYKESITVEDISNHICVTKSHLHHLFMQTMQISPKKYINLKRVSKAQRLILMGEKPSEVFVHCGFNDYATFFRNYVLTFGYPPSEEKGITTEEKIKS